MRKVPLVIIGSGPAGYGAAIYASRAKLDPLIMTGSEIGGQLVYTSKVENFPGFPEGVIGSQLMMKLKAQAEKFGAKVEYQSVLVADFSHSPFKLWSSSHGLTELENLSSLKFEKYLELRRQLMSYKPDYLAQAVIIATGATAKMLGLPGEQNILGKGVSTCAVCDAAFFNQKKVFVIGGGDSAMEDALALTKFTDQVTIVHRRGEFRASQIMQERVLNHPHIQVIWNGEVTKINGGDRLKSIVIKTKDSTKEYPADGLFFAIGHQPASMIVRPDLKVTDQGYIGTAQSSSLLGIQIAQSQLNSQDIVPYPSMTSVPGVFAAGDVVDLRFRQASTAAGFGVMAALDAEKWLMHQIK
ncbi:MAG TPA: FAD-dependent oxidoreductase [Candidatus Woesebacteria bacterium]|nr:FAD-dependent oxidoreductase [Candidatus Woesebacteria bacterium]